MAFLPSTWPGYITVQETQFKAADSEYTQQRLGQTANYLKDSNDAILLNITTLARVAVGSFAYGVLGFGNYIQFTTPNNKQIYSVVLAVPIFGGSNTTGLLIPGHHFGINGGSSDYLEIVGGSNQSINLSVNIGPTAATTYIYSILYEP